MGWTLFVEQELGTHWRVRTEATDLFGWRFSETQEKYDGQRSIESLEEIERRRRRSSGFVSLSFRRSTGVRQEFGALWASAFDGGFNCVVESAR